MSLWQGHLLSCSGLLKMHQNLRHNNPPWFLSKLVFSTKSLLGLPTYFTNRHILLKCILFKINVYKIKMYLHQDLEKGYFTSDRKNYFYDGSLENPQLWLTVNWDRLQSRNVSQHSQVSTRQIYTSHHDLVSPSTSDAYISIFGEMHWADAGLLSDPLTTLHPRVTSWPELRP